ncbi:Flp pilus assembly complex ATPase component TadA [Candidatus Nomurabacteria bacterium]|nr:Flp pilus assembly complex ATPase component TadA [Candidatus Nomurabacteria bacterium]
MNTSRLVDFLQENNKLSKAQADEVRVELTKGSKSEESILVEKGYVTEEDIVMAKSTMFNIPYVDLKKVQIEDSVFSLIGADKLKKYQAVPFDEAGHVVKVAMADPFDIQAIQALESYLQKNSNVLKILVHIATQEGIQFILDSHIGGFVSTEVSDALEDVDLPITELKGSEADLLESANIESAPVTRIVNSIMQYAIKSSASDIHIEPQETNLRVRFRVNGVMVEKLSLPKTLKNSVVARVKIMSDLKIDEKRVPQDGRLQVRSGDKKFDVRVSTLPSIYGEKVVMRLLDGSSGVPALETSGLRGGAYQNFMDALKVTNGIILVTGPTGSGKTRTLAGALDKLNQSTVNIITLENPVEIRIPGVTQVQINPDVGLTFANGLRSVLRQDPDIVMVGEIRDHETAGLAVEASLTGHLVLATLHTNSAAASIPRLLDMGIESYLLASTLRLAVAQRLPRRICRHCFEAYPAPQEVVQNIRTTLSSIKNFDPISYLQSLCQQKDKDGAPEHLKDLQCPVVKPDGSQEMYLYRGKGCSRCGGSGYEGRIGIFEVLEAKGEILSMISERTPDSEINKAAIAEGMVSMTQDGYIKAIEGITTIEEILRVSKE